MTDDQCETCDHYCFDLYGIETGCKGQEYCIIAQLLLYPWEALENITSFKYDVEPDGRDTVSHIEDAWHNNQHCNHLTAIV